MAPNTTTQTLLSYENEDVELLPTYLKRGYRTLPLLWVNGTRVPDTLAAQARPNQTLLSFLREVMLLKGSKLGCAEGGCGACTVMLSKYRPRDDDVTNEKSSIRHYSVNACLMPVLAADGCHVTTVEGIGSFKSQNSNSSSTTQLHPVQQAMVDLHGSQCGFCTPGIIVSIYTLLTNEPSVSHLEEHLDGNLCRCTGYRPIWDAARSLCLDATTAATAVEHHVVKGPCGTSCRECPERDECQQDCNLEDKDKESKQDDNLCCSTSSDKMIMYQDTFLKDTSWLDQPNQMFPNELLDPTSTVHDQLAQSLIVVDKTPNQEHAGGTWFKPTSLVELLTILDENYDTDTKGACKIVVGNTEVGIEMRFKHAVYPRLVFPSDLIPELYNFSVTPTSLVIGSCCPLSTIQDKCGQLGKENPSWTRTVMPIHDMLRWFASTQIRNVACLGGNLVTASPISDMNPLLASMGATLILSSMNSKDGTITQRSIPVTDFFLRYRTVNLQPTELVERIEVPLVRKVFEYVKPFKQARRREDDISIVTAGMRMRLEIQNGKFIIAECALVFGGMAIKTVVAVETVKAMVGSELCEATIEKASHVLLTEFDLPNNVPGGQAAFRMTLTASFLRKFYLSVIQELQADINAIRADPASFPDYSPSSLPAVPVVDEAELASLTNFLSEKKPTFTGVQRYPKAKVVSGLEDSILPPVPAMAATNATNDHVVVGKPVTHQSAPLHCTGEAAYTDDVPLPPGTLQAALVFSTECGGVLESIDASPALSVAGVVGVYTHEDLVAMGGDNAMGPIVKDELVFLPIGETVRAIGQVLGIVVAESLESAELGARLVSVQYGEKPKEQTIVSIDDAIEANSFYDFSRHTLERGDLSIIDNLSSLPDASGKKPSVGDVVKVSGTFRSGGQEHFYLEPNSTLVVPSEADTNLTIYCSTQAPTKTQNFCASATATPASKVVVRVKRMGGGFGGKETRSVFASAAAAVAAKASSRPVRLTLSRDVDMKTTGGRHAFVFKYKASAKVTADGAKLDALDIELYANGGYAFDLSGPVVDRALFHVDGCYMFPNFRAVGVPCKTSQPPHTAFRGFGGPQGMVGVEHVMEHLALCCHVPVHVLRRSNMYKAGDHTPSGMIIGGESCCGDWNVPAMWDRLDIELDISQRRALIDDFNSKHKWLKRGLSMIPTKFGIAFTAKYMNQGGALVHLYTDGTVLVSHGGTEMGQGLHSKVCQVAAQAFGISIQDVYVNDSSTDKVANTIPTAASMSTDMYGMATLDACRQILQRLQPIREKLGPDAPLKEVAKTAFMERIDLSAHGFFTIHNSRCGFDWALPKPDDFPVDKEPWNSWKGHPFNYFTQGVACSEVEVDLLSGNHRIIRSDILMDVGSSINPAIDIGQIEGAFFQGVGWCTIEEMIYADDDHVWIRPRGSVFTAGPGTYKIPAFNDAPEVFNVTLLENAINPFAVHSSKAIGEPPFFMGASVFYSIKDAVQSARKHNLGDDAYFEMRMPATSERIRMYGADPLSLKAASRIAGSEDAAKSFQPQGSY